MRTGFGQHCGVTRRIVNAARFAEFSVLHRRAGRPSLKQPRRSPPISNAEKFLAC
jgi:hypothetical protein